MAVAWLMPPSSPADPYTLSEDPYDRYILGHNYIAGARSGAGDISSAKLRRPERRAHCLAIFLEATEAGSGRRGPGRRQCLPGIPSTARVDARRIPRSHRRPNWMPWVTISSPRSAAKPPFRPHVFRANVPVPAARCDCSPRCCDAGISRRTHRPGPAERQPLPRPTCASTAWALARSPCSAPAISPWPSPRPAVIPPLRSRRVARSCSRRTVATWRRPNGSLTRSFAQPKRPGCRRRVQHDLRRRCRRWLVKHPAIKAVGFTGSLKGGRALCDMAAARPEPIPVFAEMSSINPVLLLPRGAQARGTQIAAELAASVVQGCRTVLHQPGLVIGITLAEFSAFLIDSRAILAVSRHRPCSTPAGCATTPRASTDCMHIPASHHLAGQATTR